MSYSHEQQRFYMQNYRNQLRQEVYSLLGGKCCKCGSIGKFEIDHKNKETKKFSIARKWTIARRDLLKELEKCQLLCQGCHKAKTKLELSVKPIRHGTVWGYIGRNCRCIFCKEAKALSYKKYYYHTSPTG